jgi:putative transposase
MPRANRHSLPGHIWHITHRCHRQQFLLKFARDRRLWRHWLYEARKRFGLSVLNFTVTSNHIHLLVQDRGQREIAKSMQLIAGRTAQAYNMRKQRRGAYWEDRYHATAVEAETHLARCITYIDLNMVRAGAVSHPEQWKTGGYREIQNPPERYRVIDYPALIGLLGIPNLQALHQTHRTWIEEELKSEQSIRDERWSASLAIGSQAFVSQFQAKLGISAMHRSIEEYSDSHVLRETTGDYSLNMEDKIAALTGENVAFLDEPV